MFKGVMSSSFQRRSASAGRVPAVVEIRSKARREKSMKRYAEILSESHSMSGTLERREREKSEAAGRFADFLNVVRLKTLGDEVAQANGNHLVRPVFIILGDEVSGLGKAQCGASVVAFGGINRVEKVGEHLGEVVCGIVDGLVKFPAGDGLVGHGLYRL